MEFVIETKELGKNFNGRRVLRDISLKVPRGSIFGFIGPNGAGKTTTIRLLLGLLKPSSGSANVLGLNSQTQSIALRSKVGYVAEDNTFYPWMRVEELIRFNSGFFPSWDHHLARSLLEMFDLHPGTKVKDLSKGMRTQLGLTMALAHRPELLILDEPTAGLDPQSARNLREIILEIKAEGRTVLLTTHYMEEADQLCDRIAIIDHGKIIALDTPDMLKNLLEEKTLFSIELQEWNELWEHALVELGARNVKVDFNERSRSYQITLHLNGGLTAGDALTYLVNNNAGVVNFTSKVVSLEDVFIHLTGKSLRE